MSDFILTMLDTTGVQDYIFGSNRLQENIGASELVYQATTLWVFDILEDCKYMHNMEIEKIGQSKQLKIQDNPNIEAEEKQDAEVVYTGGGNTFIIFRNRNRAVEFTQKLTRRILIDAPGLSIAVQHLSFNFEKDNLWEKRKKIQKEMAKHKHSRLPSSPMLGLGVTAVCSSTGLPATRDNKGDVLIDGKTYPLKMSKKEETRLLSPEIEKKLAWRDQAMTRLKTLVGDKIDFPSDMDKLGRIKGEESYVAVVHADGNRMGKHIDAIDNTIKNGRDILKSNREYICQLRSFSNSINETGIEALKTTVMVLVKNMIRDEKTKSYKLGGEIPIQDSDNKGKWLLPFRPLVFGGDDVTFVCNGQIAVSLAAIYLDAFEREAQKRNLDVFASAGIAIVKVHYPFARAYQMSEALCKSAKNLLKNEDDASALDWHFAPSGLSGSLNIIRNREYLIKRISREGKKEIGNLCMRPLRLYIKEHDQTGRYWKNGIEKIILEFKGEHWKKRRNKVKGLYLILREGAEKVESYRKTFELPLLPELAPFPSDHPFREKGWWSDQCIYFDAIELMDHYVSLNYWEDGI